MPRYLYLVALDVRESVKVVLGKRRNIPRLPLDIAANASLYENKVLVYSTLVFQPRIFLLV